MQEHTVDKYPSDENDTFPESGRRMTTPEPGAPLAAAGPGASRGGGQGTFGYGVGMGSSDTASEDEHEDMTSPDSSDEDGDGDISMTSLDNSDEDGGEDIDTPSSDATEETGNDQHEGHAGSVASSVMEMDSDDGDMEIDENGGAYANRGNVEQWLNGAYTVGYGRPRNAQEDMQHFDRDFGILGL